MAKVIKLMAEYGAYPLWWEGPEVVGSINPAKLPISPNTLARLLRWQEAFEAQLNLSDPVESQYFTPEELNEFEQEGLNLWRLLREELSPDYEIVYFSERLRKVLQHPTEFHQTA